MLFFILFIINLVCTFLLPYLRGKEEEKYQKKKEARKISTSSLCSAVFIRFGYAESI